MASDPPGSKTATENVQDILPGVGRVDGSQGFMVPFELIAPLIDAKVGQVKGEMERDFADRLAQIDELPTKWQLIAGGASAVVVTIGLLFGLLAYFGDRQDTAVERSTVLTEAVTEIQNELEDMRDEQSQREIRRSTESDDRP